MLQFVAILCFYSELKIVHFVFINYYIYETTHTCLVILKGSAEVSATSRLKSCVI